MRRWWWWSAPGMGDGMLRRQWRLRPGSTRIIFLHCVTPVFIPPFRTCMRVADGPGGLRGLESGGLFRGIDFVGC